MYMYKYIHTYVCVCIHLCMYVCAHTYTYVLCRLFVTFVHPHLRCTAGLCVNIYIVYINKCSRKICLQPCLPYS